MKNLAYGNQYSLFCLLLVFIAFPFTTWAKEDGGLILSGLDTMRNSNGMDFVLQRPCTSSTDIQCNSHFSIGLDGILLVAWINGQGRMLDLGKLNLDSVKSAPADSVMKDDLGLGQPYMFFKIAPDSLSKCIGNVYLLKTATDNRPGYGMPLYAKIKIIKFIVIDSASHQIKMVFLWGYNDSGTKDLTTSGLDTFHLDSTPISHRASGYPQPAPNNGAMVFKVVTDKFTVPAYLKGKNAMIAVYDLAGKMLGKVAVGNAGVIDLRKFGGARGVVVVRVER